MREGARRKLDPHFKCPRRFPVEILDPFTGSSREERRIPGDDGSNGLTEPGHLVGDYSRGARESLGDRENVVHLVGMLREECAQHPGVDPWSAHACRLPGNARGQVHRFQPMLPRHELCQCGHGVPRYSAALDAPRIVIAAVEPVFCLLVLTVEELPASLVVQEPERESGARRLLGGNRLSIR